jgi:rhamnosyltransferase
VAPIIAGNAAVSYARQIPHDGANWFEAFPRIFNYPERSELRSAEDIGKLGAYTFFCSDSCAAWSNDALAEIGGFQPTISLEDTIAVAKLLQRGHKIAYCADAVVKHSHNYSLKQEFGRHFTTGYVRRKYRELLCVGGGDEGRGATFVSNMLKQLAREKPHLIPYAVVSSAVKLIGYRAGWYWNAAFPNAL